MMNHCYCVWCEKPLQYAQFAFCNTHYNILLRQDLALGSRVYGVLVKACWDSREGLYRLDWLDDLLDVLMVFDMLDRNTGFEDFNA